MIVIPVKGEAVGCLGGDSQVSDLDTGGSHLDFNVIHIGGIAVVALTLENQVDITRKGDRFGLILIPAGGRLNLRICNIIVTRIVSEINSRVADGIGVTSIYLETFGIGARAVSVNPERNNIAVGGSEVHRRED